MNWKSPRGRMFGLTLALTLAGVVSMTGCSKKQPVATINGLAISEDEFGQRCSDFVPSADQPAISVGLQVLETVIRLKVLEKEAERLKILPSDADVDHRLAVEKKQMAFLGQPLEEHLRAEGRSEAAYRQQVRDQLLQINYFMRDIPVSDAEARQYYDSHLDNPAWSKKERIRLSEILVKTPERLKKVADDLRGNAAFDVVASAYSEDQFQSNRGQVPGWFTRDHLQASNLPIPPQALVKAFALNPGQYSTPIRMGIDPQDPKKAVWVIVRLEEKQPAARMPFEEVREQAIDAVRGEKARPQISERQQQFGKLMGDAEIEVSRPEWQEFVRVYRQRFDAMTTQPEPSETAPRSATGGP